MRIVHIYPQEYSTVDVFCGVLTGAGGVSIFLAHNLSVVVLKLFLLVLTLNVVV